MSRKKLRDNSGRAKNVILFVADGMDPTTVTAARIFDGQSRGEDGEENLLSFEAFPHLAMAKTYTTNFQVPDSAGTMTAMVTGVKTRSGVLSISHEAETGNCEDGLAYEVKTLGELAEQAGMAVGVVSTASITHATPGAVYAHAASRGWESDASMSPEAIAAGCRDIAKQLVEFPYGDGIDVALGGGRTFFLPATTSDPEYPDKNGSRKDNKDLTAQWSEKSSDHKYVWNQAGFDALKPGDKPLGLFERSHVQFELARATDKGGEPSLTEMTRKAISLLEDNRNGFFLMVEAGKVDHAHHGGSALGAMVQMQGFANAVAASLEMTNPTDTLIVVTGDHGHTLTIQGYPAKGNNILGLAQVPAKDGTLKPILGTDGKPYTTLSYANGPGSLFGKDVSLPDGRPALTAEAVADPTFKPQSLTPTSSETHGGQDVPIYAIGPNAHLFTGTVEQNYIFHVIDDALQLRERANP